MFEIENKKEIHITKSVRFSSELLDKIEELTKNNNITFSKFVILACEYALKNIDKSHR